MFTIGKEPFLERQRVIPFFYVACIVQFRNWRKIPDFVDLLIAFRGDRGYGPWRPACGIDEIPLFPAGIINVEETGHRRIYLHISLFIINRQNLFRPCLLCRIEHLPSFQNFIGIVPYGKEMDRKKRNFFLGLDTQNNLIVQKVVEFPVVFKCLRRHGVGQGFFEMLKIFEKNTGLVGFIIQNGDLCRLKNHFLSRQDNIISGNPIEPLNKRKNHRKYVARASVAHPVGIVKGKGSGHPIVIGKDIDDGRMGISDEITEYGFQGMEDENAFIFIHRQGMLFQDFLIKPDSIIVCIGQSRPGMFHKLQIQIDVVIFFKRFGKNPIHLRECIFHFFESLGILPEAFANKFRDRFVFSKHHIKKDSLR